MGSIKLIRKGAVSVKICCPCCTKQENQALFQTCSIPVMPNQLCRTKNEAKAVPRGDIFLVRCGACGTVWNRDYQPERMSYDAKYDNSQDLGQEYQVHFRRMLDFLTSNVDLREKKVLEIGCGKGRFLTSLAKKTGCLACGVDPSYLGGEKSADGLCSFIKGTYDQTLAQSFGEGAFDCVIMRQVFDQLPNPGEVMRNIAFNLRMDGYLYVEGLEFQNLLTRRSILDLSYERRTYFTAESLKRVMSNAGIEMTVRTTGFHGQYMAALGRKNAEGTIPDNCESRVCEGTRPWGAEQDLARARGRLEELGRAGRLARGGAANRGVMFCNLLDRETVLIDCVVDILPAKQGGFLPGSGHPIIAPKELEAHGIRWVIAANRNYEQEIKKQLQDMGSRAGVLTAEEILGLD